MSMQPAWTTRRLVTGWGQIFPERNWKQSFEIWLDAIWRNKWKGSKHPRINIFGHILIRNRDRNRYEGYRGHCDVANDDVVRGTAIFSHKDAGKLIIIEQSLAEVDVALMRLAKDDRISALVIVFSDKLNQSIHLFKGKIKGKLGVWSENLPIAPVHF